LLLIICTFACQPTPPADTNTEEPTAATQAKTFDIHRGLNISHWLSQSDRRGAEREAYFTEVDVKAAKAAGFDHIRIPIDEEQMWDEDGNKEAAAFELLHNALGWLHQHEMKALVDLHIIRSHYFLDELPALYVSEKEQQKFAQLWTQLATELKAYPKDEVAYELLNESVAPNNADWNKVYRLAYDAVREVEPDRVIFIGPNRWQQVDNFPDLDLPKGDKNIVLSFHYYEPFIISHYLASWTNLKNYDGPINYPGVLIDPKDTLNLSLEEVDPLRHFVGVTANRETIEAAMQPAFSIAKETGLQLYCGEFGVRSDVPPAVREAWMRDLISIFEKHDIAWTVWDFKSNGFGMLKPSDLSLVLPESVLMQ
ncbi:MAG: glycoside hydrolase family 5 protein, partial [Bacteroidota bacterium]